MSDKLKDENNFSQNKAVVDVFNEVFLEYINSAHKKPCVLNLEVKKVYWFTGQAGSGKTELANQLKNFLVRKNSYHKISDFNQKRNKLLANEVDIQQKPYLYLNIHPIINENEDKYVIIDGDEIRSFYENSDYSIEGRKKNVDFVMKLCRFLIKNNITPIVCMVSPFKEQRRQIIKEFDGVEIYVCCSEERGREEYHVDYYEKTNPEESNFIQIDTTGRSVEKSFRELFLALYCYQIVNKIN